MRCIGSDFVRAADYRILTVGSEEAVQMEHVHTLAQSSALFRAIDIQGNAM